MIRYLVERIRDGAFLELELPVSVESAGQGLSVPGWFAGTVEPDIGALRDDRGELLLDPGSAYIHEEVDGIIRGTWVLDESKIEGEAWKLKGSGFSHFFEGRPFEGEYRGINVDPVAAARHVIVHAQSFAGADIGVRLVGSSSVRVGTDSDEKQDAAQKKADDAKAASERAKKALDKARDTAKKNNTPGNKALVEIRKKEADTANERKKKADEALSAAKQKASDDGGAWKLLWWDTPDCFTAIDDAIAAAGMEWVEWSGWNADRTKILKEIRAVDRVGRKQDSLLFVEGDNIIETVVVEDSLSEYANTVLAIGAGEGRQTLRVTVGQQDTRFRKVHVLDAKDVTKKAVLERRAHDELKIRSAKLRIEAIRVMQHDFAQFGTFGVGDTILVDAEVSWLGRVTLWRRITELERLSDEVIDLTLGDA